MLILRRHLGERIVIGTDIEVTVAEIHRSYVKLAIKSSSPQRVIRGEVVDAVEVANRSAATSVLENEAGEFCVVRAIPLARSDGEVDDDELARLSQGTRVDAAGAVQSADSKA